MSKLERWLPFRFNRKDEQEKKHDAMTASQQQAGVVPWSLLGNTDPWGRAVQVNPMHQIVRDFFNDPFFKDPFRPFEQMDRWFGNYSPQRYAPNIEISDDSKAIKVTAELPGMSKDDVKIQIDEGALVISGEKKSEEECKNDGVYRTERFYGYFHRAIPLPEDVDLENADAEFKKGVLTVRLPRLEPSKPKGRRIEVKG